MRRKTLVVVLLLALLFVITKPRPKAPTITLKTDRIVLEAHDDFSLDLLSMYIKAEAENGDRISFKELEIIGDVDPNTVGSYPLRIKAKDPNTHLVKNVLFTVEVVDTVFPEIISLNETIVVYDNEDINLDPAANLIFAYDANEGIITDRITYEGTVKKKSGTYPVVYTISDKSGNTTSKTINFKVTYSMDEYLHYAYEKAINIYWGKYFIISKDNEILNFNEVLKNTFNGAGISQFYRGCGLEKNSDGTRGGVRIKLVGDKYYLLEDKESIVNNYLSTEFAKVSIKGSTLKYKAKNTYQITTKKTLVVENDFILKKSSGKYYIESFVLPNS